MAKSALIVSWKVKPGRVEEFLAVHTEGMKQMTAAPGSPTYTVWQTQSGPGDEPHLQFSAVLEFASASAYGEFLDAMASDPKTNIETLNSFFPEDPPAIELSTRTVTEVPLG